MEDRDGKKPFIIPKTYTSNKDVLISEKTDSRNFIELFNDIKSCSLELHYDFRQNQCKSFDIIRNQKLQKSYNQRKIQMKKDHDTTERYAFHLITSNETALNIANDGLSCEQLSFPIEKYLGNVKDGIHLSRRPDVILASSGAQGLYKFGLLVCKIILSKGYPTIPSMNNKQLSAQLHYDYHFCKIQPVNKEQRHIDDLLANSLIFCYEHEEFQIRSHPSQILPLAILWYDLVEKFPIELTSTTQESQQQHKLKKSFKTKAIPSANLNGTWDEPIQNISNTPPTIQITPTKYSNQLMIPYSSLYTSFCDSRLIQKVITSETIPLSPSNSITDLSSLVKQTHNEKKLPLKDIPLNSTIELIDPRLKTLKQTHDIFYLESQTVKHVLQQQKRLKHYYGTKSKTNYILIPFHIHSISLKDYERKNSSSSSSSSSLFVSVTDCFHFGLKKSSNQLYIDLEDNENQIGYQQIQKSNQLIEYEKKLNSQENRLYSREKRQRKIQEQINEQKKTDLIHAKNHIQNGRKLLKEHQEIKSSSNNQISLELLNFFSYEYRHEHRPHVKRILAELLGIFIEKYQFDYTKLISKTIEAPQTINSVIDMELESPCSQALGDHDERFRIQTPPIIESIPSLSNIQTYNESNIIISDQPPIQLEIPLVEPIVVTNDKIMETSLLEETNNNIIDNQSKLEINDNSIYSRDEFVKLLTKEAFTSNSSSPTEPIKSHNDDDNDESNSNTKLSSTRTVTLVSNNHEDNLIIKATNIDTPEEATEEEEEEEQQPIVKRIKVDLSSPPPLLNENIKSPATTSDDHDYRHDCDERRRRRHENEEEAEEKEISRSRSSSKSTSSHNSSTKESNTKSSYPFGQQRRYEQNRSSNKAYHIQRSNKSNPTPIRHQRFNYNHQSVADHPRFANMDTIKSPEKNYNYNSFNTSNYSQNRNVNSSYYNNSQSDYPYYQDNYINNFPQPQPLMSATPLVNYSNSKPSHTIERLQMLLENTNTSYDQRQSSYQIENSNYQNWTSSTPNNQTFTCNDAEQLLTFVQHLRN